MALSTGSSLSLADARAITLAAQGLDAVGVMRAAPASARALSAAIRRMAALQIDSVNVFARSHYLPLFSRVGHYDTAHLDRLLFSQRAPFVESWAHVAAFIPREDWGLFAFRSESFREHYSREGQFLAEHADIVTWVREELRTRGPLRPAQFDHDLRRGARGAWWDWDGVKSALEHMWRSGEVAIAGRRGFERTYALAEQVLHDDHRAPVDRDTAIRVLVSRAARAYGVATASDISEYWRIRDRAAVQAALNDLTDAGELIPVTVDGWQNGSRPLPAWRHRDARRPRRTEGTTILTPFDPLVWFRDRAERLFDLTYRIEIYTPAARRQYGYYSLPVLMEGAIAGRVDLKADRANRRLLVQSAWWEEGVTLSPDEAAPRLAQALRDAASWQGLDDISVGRWGTAADAIAGELGAPRHDRTISA